jgi:hypothetical protein
MLTNLPWHEVSLGIAAAIGALVIYDILFVWPIHRRISELTDRCSVLERSLSRVLADLAARVEATDHRGREDLGKLGERLGQLELATTDSQAYEQAIGCAEKGEETSRLRSCFGLTEGEADLVMLLHGEASRRAEVEKFARRLIDSAQV